MAKPQFKPLTAEVKERLVRACQDRLHGIAYDLLANQPNHSMTAEDARSYLADFMYDEPEWRETSWDDHDLILKEAIPNDICL